MMIAVGTRLMQQLQPLRPDLQGQLVMPVKLPPGRFRLGTSPSATGSVPVKEDDWNRCRRRLCASSRGVAALTITVTWRRTRSAASAGSRSIGLPPSDIRSPHCGPRQSRSRSGLGGTPQTTRVDGASRLAAETDHRDHRLLRARLNAAMPAADPAIPMIKSRRRIA